MEKTTGELMLTEMDTYLSANASAELETESAMPFETLDEYNTDPLKFADVTAKLFQKVTAVFDLAVKYNRHSSEYLKSCAQLEKGIKYLGSSCLQKYALEKKNYTFSELGQLNTANLYTMASIQFNKIDRALSEYMEQKQTVDDALLDMEYRYYHLMERIRATEVKIFNYDIKRCYEQEDYSPVVHGLAFSEKSWTKNIHKTDEPMAFQRARAFSSKSEIGNQKSEIRDRKSEVEDSASILDLNTQDSVDEKDRIENETTSAVQTSENEGMQREQFSKRETRSSIKEQVIGESCNQTVTSESSLNEAFVSDKKQKSPISTEQTKEREVSQQVPNFIKILRRVVMRSRQSNLDYLGFTEDEMMQLNADSGFARFQPELAAEIRKALEGHDSG